MRLLGCVAGMLGIALTSVTCADPAAALKRAEIVELVREKTIACRKEKDQSLCSNWFSKDGVVRRLMHDDGARKEGVWFVDDQDRLCILWKAKIKPLCFDVYAQDDGTYNLIKRGKHITTILGRSDGNTKDL